MSANDIPPDVRAAASTLLTYFVGIVRNEAAKVATNDNGAPEYYTAKTAPMQPTTFLRHGKGGAYRLVKVGREYRAPRAEVDAWLARQPTAAPATADRSDAAPNTERSAEELLEVQRREEAEQGKPAPRPRRR